MKRDIDFYNSDYSKGIHDVLTHLTYATGRKLTLESSSSFLKVKRLMDERYSQDELMRAIDLAVAPWKENGSEGRYPYPFTIFKRSHLDDLLCKSEDSDE